MYVTPERVVSGEILNDVDLAQVFLWFQEKSLFGMGALLHNPNPGACVRACVRAAVHSCSYSYIHTYMHAYVHTYTLSWALTILKTAILLFVPQK